MKKIIILVFMLIFCVGNCSFAMDYSVYKLENGQTVIVKQVKNNPIVIIDTWIKTGSINENSSNNGVSHFLEHLFFKVSETHPAGTFDKILESKGAITNAATSKDFTHYYVEIPSKYFDLALDLHADMLLNPMIPRKELEKERKVVMEEIAKDANNPQEKLYNNLINLLYTTHPYKRKVIGTNEIIGKISREEILSYYKTHYGPQNMITIIIGDVDPQHAIEKVKEEFKTEPRKIEQNKNKPEKKLSTQKNKIAYENVQGGYMMIGYRGANALNKDTYALDVLATILGDGHSSILYHAIKEQKQLAYSISASNATYKEDGIFVISSKFNPKNNDKLKCSIFDEINKVRKNGVSQEQLNLAKKIIETDTYFSRESIANISTEIGYTTILTNNPKYYDEYLNKINKVSASDVKRVAQEYLSENKSAISIVLPETSKDNIAQKDSATTKSDAKFIINIEGTEKYALNNGSQLLITKNDLNDIIAISIYIKGGEFLEQIPGTANLMSTVMLKGTQKYSALELAKEMDENGIKIVPSASADTFNISVLTTKSNLTKTFELLNEIINHATFDDYEIDKSKRAKLEAIKNSRDIPLNRALEEYKEAIYQGSPYSYGSKTFEKTLSSIKKNDLIQYYNTIFNPKNIVISVNGNITDKEISQNLTEIFKNKNKSAMFNYTKYQIPSVKAQKNITQSIPDNKTAWILIGWQVPGVLTEKDCATLQVIDSILGSGMSSRLFKNVRDQEGLAYQLGSSYSPKILKGAFSLYIGTNPKTAQVAKEKMLAEINKLKTEFVSDKELKEAKEKIIGNYIISLETNLSKASTIGWFEASGRSFAFKTRYEKLIEEVTASDIIEVMNKYFNDNYVTVTIN